MAVDFRGILEPNEFTLGFRRASRMNCLASMKYFYMEWMFLSLALQRIT